MNNLERSRFQFSFLSLIRGWIHCWATTPRRGTSSSGSRRTCSFQQATVRTFFVFGCCCIVVSFNCFVYSFLERPVLIGILFCRNGVAGKLPSPPLSPLLGHPIENNNNINNNMDGSPSAKSTNGPVESGEVRRKVNEFIENSCKTHQIETYLSLYPASSNREGLLYRQRVADDRADL